MVKMTPLARLQRVDDVLIVGTLKTGRRTRLLYRALFSPVCPPAPKSAPTWKA